MFVATVMEGGACSPNHSSDGNNHFRDLQCTGDLVHTDSVQPGQSRRLLRREVAKSHLAGAALQRSREPRQTEEGMGRRVHVGKIVRWRKRGMRG